MILRKPYALLIKNFKKIHLVLCILMVYVAFESANILTFFNEYIATGTFTRTSFSLSSTYINIYIFIVTILVAAIGLVIYILMREKNKPKLLYFFIIAFYIGLIVYFFQIYNTLDVIEVSAISPRSLRITRDVASILCYIQYSMVLLMAIRAVGFNIKKFNFGEDLAELEIDVTDNEEFELTVGIDQDKIGRRLRRGRREFKYFIIENFFVLSLIFLVVVTSFSVVLFLNIEVYNKVYAQSDAFKANYFVNIINNSYFTHLNQRGAKTAPTGKIFVVTKVTFNNKDIYPRQLSLDDINLTSGTNIFSPIITRYQSFLDLGEGYTNQIVQPGEVGTFIFVFEVDETVDFNNIIFRYRESLKISTTRLEAKYKKIRLSGVTLDTITKVRNAKFGEELAFTSSALDNTKLKVNDVQIESQFAYDATSCYNNSCNIVKNNLTLQYTTTQKLLMKLSFDYNKDSKITLGNANTLSDLVRAYGFVRYSGNDKTFSTELVDKTPSNYNGKDLYYQVPSGLKLAEKIELVLRVRDKEFVYNLK